MFYDAVSPVLFVLPMQSSLYNRHNLYLSTISRHAYLNLKSTKFSVPILDGQLLLLKINPENKGEIQETHNRPE